MQAPPPATNTTTTTATTIEHPQLHQSRVLIAPPPPMPLVHPPSGDAYYGSDASLGSTATGTSSLSHSLYSSSRDSLGPHNGVQGHMPLPASRMNRPPSRGTLRSTASSTHNSQPHVQQQMQPPLGPALAPPPQSTTAAATTTLKVSVKQRNGSVATITTTPAKVTRGFSSSAASPSNPSAFVGSHGSQEGSIGRFGGSRSFEDSGILGFSPSQDSNAGFNAGTSYASSRHSGKSASDLHNGGIYGSGTIYASASGGDSGGVSGLPQNTRRMYSNASSASATSLQTFFGVGEGQALKERLKREQEMKEQYYQQMLALEQQQIRQQQQLLVNRKSQKDLLNRSSSTTRVDSKDVIQQHKEDEATTESTMSGGDRKASFAIGIEEDEFTDEEEEEENQEQGDSSQKLGRDFKASMRSSGSSDHQSGTISQNPPRKQSPNMLTPPDSSTVDTQFIVRPASRNNNHGNNTNSPLLTRRTFPSAPYLPLYNLPKPVSASVKSPTTTATKLLLNPNPNSSSAADIPVLSAKSSPAMNGSSSEADTGVPAPPPIPIARTTSHQQSTTHVTNTTNNPMLKTQPPELQAPLHQTPSANAISEADIQAAAAAARARGQNLPRTIPEFYKRLQDLRGHNIQQLVALRDQISLLKKETKAAAGTADGTGPGNGVEYYEREMGRVIELARRDEGHLVEFGRRGMGIDVNTLSLMLSNLPTFDPNVDTSKPPRSAPHRDQYPHTQDHIRRTKSFVSLQMQQHHFQQQQPPLANIQPLQRAFSTARLQQAPAAEYPVIPRSRSHARVVDMNAVQREQMLQQQLQQQQQVGVGKQQVEFLQMQYNTQVNHLAQNRGAPAALQQQQQLQMQQMQQQQMYQQQQQQLQQQQQQQQMMLQQQQNQHQQVQMQQQQHQEQVQHQLHRQQQHNQDGNAGGAIFSTVAQFSGEYDEDDGDSGDDLEEHDVGYVGGVGVGSRVVAAEGTGLGLISG